MAHRQIDPLELGMVGCARLLNHCVAPRPIAFVSTLSTSNQANLAPFSYFMAGGANPPSVVISTVGGRDGGEKDTLINIKARGEFTISVVTQAMAERMNVASTAFPHGVSEWEKAGFEPRPSVHVAPPVVAESPLAIECRLFQIVPHGPGPLSAHYIIGEVVGFHLDERVLEEAESLPSVDPKRIAYLSRLGGDWYATTEPATLFPMERP